MEIVTLTNDQALALDANYRGNCLLVIKGNLDDSIEFYEEAARIDPQNPTFQRILVRTTAIRKRAVADGIEDLTVKFGVATNPAGESASLYSFKGIGEETGETGRTYIVGESDGSLFVEEFDEQNGFSSVPGDM